MNLCVHYISNKNHMWQKCPKSDLFVAGQERAIA